MSESKPIDCEQALSQVLEFVDRELGPEEHAAMQAHLHACKSCFSRAEFERRLKEKLLDLRDAAAPEARARLEKLIKTL